MRHNFWSGFFEGLSLRPLWRFFAKAEFQEKLMPCPFCGEMPKLTDGNGTQYEIECDCGMARSSVQISDLMTIDERVNDKFKNYRYAEEYIERAKIKAIDKWNSRVSR